jgi:solute carrier family 25 carnitine/acylcarnitine transporter 20/29
MLAGTGTANSGNRPISSMEGTDGASSSSSSHGILPVRATVRRRSIATTTSKEAVATSSSSYPTTTTEATTTMSHHLLRDLAAGGIAGSAGVVVGHPFDSIKVRMQNTTAAAVVSASSSSSFSSLAPSSSPSSSTTTTGGTRALRHRNYLRGAWAGLSAPLAAASIVNASVFLTYGLSTRTWDGLRCSLEDDDDDGHSSSSSRNAMCGGIAGIVSSLVVCPVDLVKTRMQNANVIAAAASSASVGSSFSSSSSSSSLRVAREILGNHGVAGLYRGLGATVARQCPGFVAYFGSYDATRSALLPSLRRRRRRRGDDGDDGDDDGISSAAATTANATGGRRCRDELLASIAAGGLSGTLSWAIVYPLDLIKTRIQSLPHDCRACERGMVRVGSDVVRRHGWRALYRGFGITMMRAFPVNGIIFPTYEMTSEALGRMQ